MTATAQLTVRRPPPGGPGDSYPITLWLDGRKLGLLMPGETVEAPLAPGEHRLRAHNTLLAKSIAVRASDGEAIGLTVRNRSGFGSLLLVFLGTGPLYLAFDRE